MRFLISFLLLANVFNKHILCADVNIPIDRVIPDTVIHCFHEVIRHENKAVDPMDPIEFDRLEINFPSELFGANINITNGSISGLSDFQVLDMQLASTELKINFHILFPFLKFYSEYYEFDGHIFFVVPMGGKGIAHFEIHNVQFKGTLYLKEGPTSHSLRLDRLEDAEYNIERILSFTEFDQNIDLIISGIVEDLFADYLNRFNKFILITYSDAVIQYINSVLQKIEENLLINKFFN